MENQNIEEIMILKKIEEEISSGNLEKYNIDLEELKKEIIDKKIENENFFVLTSGGTKVKLSEDNNYILDNFSTGTRGSLICENLFLKNQFCIFFYRKNSKMPFTEFFDNSENEKKFNNNLQKHFQIKIKNFKNKMLKVKNKIFFIEFEYVHEYVYKLIKINNFLKKFLSSKKIIFIYAAAVSDFIIKKKDLNKNLDLLKKDELEIPLTKMIKTLNFLKNSKNEKNIFFRISFKLETNSDILEKKVYQAFQKSGSDIVIGNLLQTRYKEIFFYYKKNNIIEKKYFVKNNNNQVLEKIIVEKILNFVN